MPLNDAAFNEFESTLEKNLADALVGVMENAEEQLKSQHRWQNDTGSLEASIRGYVVGHTDPFKYFGDSRWLAAQQGRVESKYLGAYPQNTPEHYQPYVEQVPTSDNEITGVLTAFVEYGEEVENDLRVGGDWSRAMYDILQKELDSAFYGKAKWGL